MLVKSLFMSLLFTLQCHAAVVSYRPSLYTKSTTYTLKVNGTYQTTIAYTGYDYVQLSMDQGYSTQFVLTASNETSITSYSISPKQLPITATTSGNQLSFSLKDAHYLIVKINDVKEFVIMIDAPETNAPASSGTGIYNVMNYGADNTGATLTTGVQAAMDAAAKVPGSIVYVPAGVYLISNLILRNMTSLYLAGNSALRFSGKQSDYKYLFNKSDIGNGTWWLYTDNTVTGGSSTTAVQTTGIRIYGRGTIDGNGAATRATGFCADMVVPVATTNFTYDGPLIRDSSFWSVVPIQSTNVKIQNIKIVNHMEFLQNDGIDVVESTGVTINNAIAVSGDDTFSTKTWPYERGTTVPYPYQPRPLSNVVYTNCLGWTPATAYKIGFGVYTVQSSVTFENSVVYSASIAMGIEFEEGTASVNNVLYTNIDVEKIGAVNANHDTWLAFFSTDSGSGTGPISDVTVSNCRVRDLGLNNAIVQGWNSSILVSNVTLSDIYLYANTTPATTLAQLKVLDTSYSTGLKITNS